MVSGGEACVVAPMSCSRARARRRRRMENSSYSIKRPPRPNPEFDVRLSVCIPTVDEDVLSVELDQAGPRSGGNLIQVIRELSRHVAERYADANSRDRAWLCVLGCHCVFVGHSPATFVRRRGVSRAARVAAGLQRLCRLVYTKV